MNKMNKLALATATAALFSGAVVPTATAEGATVHCMGINACKGQTKCATAENACAGQNACKGQGWLPTASEEECTSKGGTVVK